LQRVRVQRAKRLLDETDTPMTEIALLAGFRSLRRFNAVFEEVDGRAPTESDEEVAVAKSYSSRAGQA
jgi:transcriptional regulator GlxA family with amidase domain